MNERLWSTLAPDEDMAAVLEAAGPYGESTDGRERGRWSVRFARAWATALANRFRKDRAFRDLEIRPQPDGSEVDALSRFGGHQRKCLGVVAATLTTGIQLAVSVKGDHFPSRTGGFARALQSRLFELCNEARAVHETQPRSYFVGALFLPVAATVDRSQTSTFARSVARLRAVIGRRDRLGFTQFDRLDWAVIALYEPTGDADIALGAVRYFDVWQPPPRVGRPRVETTMGPAELVWRIAEGFGHDDQVITYTDPESDD